MLELCNSFGTAPLSDIGTKLAHPIQEYAYIAAQANHAKSLTDPMCGGLRRRRKESGRYAVLPACGNEIVHRLKELRVVELRGDTHGNREIVMAYPRNVNSRQGYDFFKILKGLYGLQLNNDSRLLIRLGEKFGARWSIQIMRN